MVASKRKRRLSAAAVKFMPPASQIVLSLGEDGWTAKATHGGISSVATAPGLVGVLSDVCVAFHEERGTDLGGLLDFEDKLADAISETRLDVTYI